MAVYGPTSPKYGRGGRPLRRRRTVSSVKKSADKLWSQLVKARAGFRCERCGITPESAQGFHAHHVFGRSNHRLRFEPRNGCALCWSDHRWAEEMPLEFADWFREHRPEDAEWLAEENRKGLLKRNLDDYLQLEQLLSGALRASVEAQTDIAMKEE